LEDDIGKIDNDFFSFNWDIDQAAVKVVTNEDNLKKLKELKGYQKVILCSLL